MHVLILILFFIFGVFCSGCQWKDYLEVFNEQSRCEFPDLNTTVKGERHLECDVVRQDVELAKHLYEGMGYPWPFTDLTIQVWDLQVLKCTQRVMTVCVYWIKGEASGGTYPGSLTQRIELNDGGEVLLHEFLHFADDDSEHKYWLVNGKTQMDSFYRGLHKSMRGAP